MNAIKKITIKNLKRNKKRTIGTLIGISLSTMLICIVSFLITSFYKVLLDSEINNFGYYHVMIDNLKEEDLKTLKLNRDLKDVNPVYYVGSTETKSEMSFFKDHEIISMSESVSKNLSLRIMKGMFPKNEHEIIVSNDFMKYNRYKLGDTITLKVQVPIKEETKTEIKEYKIVGITDNDVYYSKIVTSNVSTYGHITAYVALKDPFDYKKYIPLLLGTKTYNAAKFREDTSKYSYYEVNENLLSVEAFAFNEETSKILIGFSSIAFFIIFIVSIFCIRNSFAIMVTEKIKMYGMLASVGATKKQIKKSVLLEGLILGSIGVPIGILLGYFVTCLLVAAMNWILGPYFFPTIETMTVYVTIVPFIVSFVLGFVTIYFSSISSSRKASRIAPIENIRNSSNIKINSKKMKTPKWVKKFFHTGGVIAYKNLKRSKRKYRATVIALTISIFCFISINFLVEEGFKEVKRNFFHYDYNISISNIADFDSNMIKEVKKIDGIKTSYETYKSSLVTDNYDVSNGYLEIYDTSKVKQYQDGSILMNRQCDETKETYEEYTASCKGGYTKIRLVGLTDTDFKHYVKRLHLNYEEVKKLGILGDTRYYYDITDDYKRKTRRLYAYDKGDTIVGLYNNNEVKIKLGQVGVMEDPSGLAYLGGGGFLVVNMDYYKDFDFILDTMAIVTDKTTEVEKRLNEISEEFEIRNIDEEESASKSLYFGLAVFLYTFITIIITIGVTSVFNTITSNMKLRQGEFAILKSVGMTKKEFHRMIHLEIIFYSLKSLFYGTILGLIGSRIIYGLLNMQEKTPYVIPYHSIFISIIFVFLFVFLMMHYSLSKTKNQNIIETIRNENI